MPTTQINWLIPKPTRKPPVATSPAKMPKPAAQPDQLGHSSQTLVLPCVQPEAAAEPDQLGPSGQIAGTSKNGAVPLARWPAKPLTPTRQDPITTSTKGKEKAVAPSDDEEEDLFNNDPDHDVEQDVEPSSPPPAGPKRGRPRKSILQDAAKRMKKF
ncbi:hypothetical protein PtA15_10A285 [Puccinia triticina]|uniref:Uncharacterized protein n=1 Tax=Puccinia triticina TaxID=208348 RepID=A0ABY7CUC9_9BASI|nr:uncharacterized protein PtA15_10A285 [Puccinia triticina]WAQ88864.1 hypothetical protein PtA15_10A285 [Puccinia triticina]